MKKEWIFSTASLSANFLLIIGIVFSLVYGTAPFFGGTLFIRPVLIGVNWICTALILKMIIKRLSQGMRIRALDHLLVCIFSILNLALWFTFPTNFVLGILTVAGVLYSYIYHKNKWR
jgi:hypothetical protein